MVMTILPLNGILIGRCERGKEIIMNLDKMSKEELLELGKTINKILYRREKSSVEEKVEKNKIILKDLLPIAKKIKTLIKDKKNKVFIGEHEVMSVDIEKYCIIFRGMDYEYDIIFDVNAIEDFDEAMNYLKMVLNYKLYCLAKKEEK